MADISAIFGLLAMPWGPAKFSSALLIFLALTSSTLGAAGLAAQMGSQLARVSRPDTAEAVLFLRGALALELSPAGWCTPAGRAWRKAGISVPVTWP